MPPQQVTVRKDEFKLYRRYNQNADAVFYHGDVRNLLPKIPNKSVQLIVTSPPYNLGKEYEIRKSIKDYMHEQEELIDALLEKLRPEGSICWQVGNYVDSGSIIPLDYLFHEVFERKGLKLRNRIIWQFRHGLHCSRRLSGRYEVILWYTNSDDYVFNLDPIRVPARYPNKKHFRGAKKGEISGNPLGANPGDIWDIPNVKANHPEKTIHPCQYPVELIERLVLALTNEDDTVMDPYAGVGSTCVAAVKRKRKSIGCEIEKKYVDEARHRIMKMAKGQLKTRLMNTPVYEPPMDPQYLAKFVDGILTSRNGNGRHP